MLFPGAFCVFTGHGSLLGKMSHCMAQAAGASFPVPQGIHLVMLLLCLLSQQFASGNNARQFLGHTPYVQAMAISWRHLLLMAAWDGLKQLAGWDQLPSFSGFLQRHGMSNAQSQMGPGHGDNTPSSPGEYPPSPWQPGKVVS